MDGQNPPAAQETLATTAEQLYVKGYAEGYAKGYAEGLTETQASLLTYMLAGEFGALDNNTRRRVAHATRSKSGYGRPSSPRAQRPSTTSSPVSLNVSWGGGAGEASRIGGLRTDFRVRP